MMIPEDARRQMHQMREGKTLKRFLNDIWDQRNAEHPGRRKSTGTWPIRRRELKQTNVTPIRNKRS